MLYDIEIDQWLAAHSENVQRTEREIVFEHAVGDNSVLLLRYAGQSGDTIACPPKLDSFYERFAGGYVGKGFLIIGTQFQKPIRTTTGIIVPTLTEIRSISEVQGIVFREGEFPFLTTGYMFVYSLSQSGQFCCHDRDFAKLTEGGGVRNLLEDWWRMKLADEE